MRGSDGELVLKAFLAALRETARDRSDTLYVAVFTAYGLIMGLATANWTAVGSCAVALVVLAYVPIRGVLPWLYQLLYHGYGREDLVRALTQEVEQERDRLVSQYGRDWNAPGRVARRVTYAGLGLAGVGAALSFVPAVPPDVGLGAMVLGTATATVWGLVGWFRARRRQVPFALWLRFWKSRVGEWVVRLEAW